MGLTGKTRSLRRFTKRKNANELNKPAHNQDKTGPRGGILWGLSFLRGYVSADGRMKPKKRLPAVVKAYLQDIGTAGGSKTSGKKQAAAQRNGELGGRPKKKR